MRQTGSSSSRGGDGTAHRDAERRSETDGLDGSGAPSVHLVRDGLLPALQTLSISEGGVLCGDLRDAPRAKEEVEDLLLAQARRMSESAAAGTDHGFVGHLLTDLTSGLHTTEDALAGVHDWAHNPCDWILV